MGRSAAGVRCLVPYALLGGLCLLLYLPGIATIPPLDRDEARFAEATREMLDTGDFLRIRFQHEARNNKPAGIYWLQAAAVAALSTPESAAIWPYRLPSLFGASGAVMLTLIFGRKLFEGGAVGEAPGPIGLFAAVLLGSALGVVNEAHIAKTDAVLLATIVAGQGALGLAYLNGRAGRPVAPWIAVVFWAAETVAILVKGPVAPALAITTAGALSIADRDAGWLRGLHPVIGLPAMALALAPWFFAIERATEGRFLAESLGRDFAAKLVSAQEAHGAPPFYYLVLAMLTFWPGSLLLAPAVARAWRRRNRPAERFLLAWIVPAWVALELVPTKLPHYALPLYPALALAAAGALFEQAAPEGGRWARRISVAAECLWMATTAVLAAALVVLPIFLRSHIAIAGLLGATLLGGLAAVFVPVRPAPVGAIAGMAALSAAFVVPAASVLPGLDRLWLSRSAAALVARHPPVADAPVVAVGYSEPSLVFLLGSALRMAPAATAAAALVGGGEALVSDREEAQFRAALTAYGLSSRSLGTVTGIDYSIGRAMVLTLYRVDPPP